MFNILVILTIGTRVRDVTRAEQHLDLQTSLLHLQFGSVGSLVLEFYFTLTSRPLNWRLTISTEGRQQLKMKMVRLPVKKNPQMSYRISSCVAVTVVGSFVVMLRKYGNDNDLRYRNGVLMSITISPNYSSFTPLITV